MVASVTTIGMVGLARGYVAPVRAARRMEEAIDQAPEGALRPAELADLFWIWNDAEAAMGIRSTFGSELERAMLYAVSNSTRSERGMAGEYGPWEQRRTALRRWVNAGHAVDAAGSPMWDAETMSIHPTGPSGTCDPYESDEILVAIGRANRIRARLSRCSVNSVKVLNAVFGPSRGDEEQRRDMRRRFGNLVPIVVAIVSAARSENDPPARAIITAKITDDSFVRLMKTRAAGILRAATLDYAGCR